MEQILKSDEFTYGKFKESNAKYFIGMKKIGIKISDILYFIGTKSTIKNMLEKYELFYNKINRIIGNQFDIWAVYMKSMWALKSKSYNAKIKTWILRQKTLKEKPASNCLAAIVFDSVCKIKNEDDKHYTQIYSEECKSQECERKKAHDKNSNS